MVVEFLKSQFWYTVGNSIGMSPKDAEHHIKDLYHRTISEQHETPELSPKMDEALRHYSKNKIVLDD